MLDAGGPLFLVLSRLFRVNFYDVHVQQSISYTSVPYNTRLSRSTAFVTSGFSSVTPPSWGPNDPTSARP